MPRSIHIPEPHHFTVGTVGPPGQRIFYLQAGDDGSLVTFKLEKQQVAALAQYLESVMADLPPLPAPAPSAPDLIEPVVPEWTVGGIGIAVDEGSDRVLLVVHELSVEPDDPEGGEAGDSQELIADEVAELLAELAGLSFDDDPDDLDDELDDEFDEDEFDEDGETSLARIRLSREQVAAFIVKAGELMEAGRALCPFCGLPLDPTGHICPREN